MVAPGVTKPEGRCPRPVSFADIYPTLCDLCGLPKPEQLEGVTLMPLLRDPKATWKRPALTTHGRNNHTIRSERWRYIRYNDGTEELYDRDKDPMEWTNLAGRPELADVKKQLAAWLPKTNVPNAPRDKGKRRKPAKGKKKTAAAHPLRRHDFGPPEPIRSWLRA